MNLPSPSIDDLFAHFIVHAKIFQRKKVVGSLEHTQGALNKSQRDEGAANSMGTPLCPLGAWLSPLFCRRSWIETLINKLRFDQPRTMLSLYQASKR